MRGRLAYFTPGVVVGDVPNCAKRGVVHSWHRSISNPCEGENFWGTSNLTCEVYHWLGDMEHISTKLFAAVSVRLQ